MADYVTTNFANMTSPMSLADDVTHVITATVTPLTVSHRTLVVDYVTENTVPPTTSVHRGLVDDWLKILNELIDKQKKTYRTPRWKAMLELSHSPAVTYACAAVEVSAGLVGNLLLFLLSFQQDIRPHSYSVYLAALSITDTACLIELYTGMILQINGIAMFESDKNITCGLSGWLMRFTMTLSPWIFLAFSVDRYIAFVHPLKRRVLCTIRKAQITCSVICLLLAAEHACVAVKMVWIRHARGVMCAINDNVSYVLSVVEQVLNSVGAGAILLAVNTVTLVNVVLGIRKRGALNPMDRTDGERGVGTREDEAESTRKMSLAILSIPLFTMVTSLPYMIISAYISIWNAINVLGELGASEEMMLKWMPHLLVVKTWGFAGNFWILLMTSGSYRSIVMKMLRRN